MWPSGVCPGLSPKDEEVKRKLIKYAPRAYFELIRSDIPRPSNVRPARLPFLRPSPFFSDEALCLKVPFIFCFGAPYREAYTRRALGQLGGAGEEEKERKTENSDFP